MAEQQPYNGPPQRGQKRYVTLSPGHEECYECGGDGACFLCGGDRTIDGKQCSDCHGRGTCLVCRGVGQLTITADDKDPYVIGLAQLAEIVAEFHDGGLNDAQLDEVAEAWHLFAADASRVEAQGSLFEARNNEPLHGLTWWEQRPQSRTAHPQHGLTPSDHVNYWLSLNPDRPNHTTPKRHRPDWLVGTWVCTEYVDDEEETVTPDSNRSITLHADGTIATENVDSIAAGTTWRYHEGETSALLMSLPEAVARTRRARLVREADDRLVLIDPAADEAESTWTRQH